MKFIKDEKEIKKTQLYLRMAADMATSSTCKKTQRGVVIVSNGKVIGEGYNKVTIEECCRPCIREDIGDNSRVELCSAVHAEQMAILNALLNGHSLDGSVMYHVKLKNGEMRPSGKPSCTVCSRILDTIRLLRPEARIKFVLWHKGGYAIYEPDELNKLSFEYFLKK